MPGSSRPAQAREIVGCMWNINITEHDDAYYVSVRQFGSTGPYPRQIADFYLALGLAETELQMLQRALSVAYEVLGERRLAE
jgi:hypothetical protein